MDVLSEAINNPIRMLAGWFIVTSVTVAPASLLLSYWMIGCYFMALKRFAEFRNIGDATRATAYRKSFRYFTGERLLVSVMFYASSAMLFFGAFCMRYRLEMILAFPAIALVMALYLHVAMKDDSAAQNPEKLYREPALMASVVGAALLLVLLLSVDLPIMQRVFTPTAPTTHGGVAVPFTPRKSLGDGDRPAREADRPPSPASSAPAAHRTRRRALRGGCLVVRDTSPTVWRAAGLSPGAGSPPKHSSTGRTRS